MRTALALQTLGAVAVAQVVRPALMLISDGLLSEAQIYAGPPIFVGGSRPRPTGFAPGFSWIAPGMEPTQPTIPAYEPREAALSASVQVGLTLSRDDVYERLAAAIAEELALLKLRR